MIQTRYKRATRHLFRPLVGWSTKTYVTADTHTHTQNTLNLMGSDGRTRPSQNKSALITCQDTKLMTGLLLFSQDNTSSSQPLPWQHRSRLANLTCGCHPGMDGLPSPPSSLACADPHQSTLAIRRVTQNPPPRLLFT